MNKELKRHRRFFSFARNVLKPYTVKKFNYQYPDLSYIEPPYLLLANHTVNLDPLLIALAFKNHMYFVASEHVSRIPVASGIIMHFCKPIIRTKGRAGVKTTAEILRTLRAGTSVCIFAEGNRTFNGETGYILPSTARMAKKSGVKLVTYRNTGGYFSEPRWSRTKRKGAMQGSLIGVYEADELSSMSDDEVYRIIVRDLHENAYDSHAQNPVEFVGKKLAEDLESAYFICPKCEGLGTIHSFGNNVSCDSCGHEFVMDEYTKLHDENDKVLTLYELDQMQHRKLQEVLVDALARNDTESAIFSDSIVIETITAKHKLLGKQSSSIRAYVNRLEFGDYVVSYDRIGMAVVGKNRVVVHLDDYDGHIEICGDNKFCAVKYLYLLQILKKEEF